MVYDIRPMMFTGEELICHPGDGGRRRFLKSFFEINVIFLLFSLFSQLPFVKQMVCYYAEHLFEMCDCPFGMLCDNNKVSIEHMKRARKNELSRTPLVVFRAIGDDKRIQILERLRQGETSASNLLVDLHITQPTLSHHMKALCEAGLVLGRRSGRHTHYSLDGDGVDLLVEYLAKLKAGMDDPSADADAEVG